jgi:3-aminobutyryl-CoA ammonia-lyase
MTITPEPESTLPSAPVSPAPVSPAPVSPAPVSPAPTSPGPASGGGGAPIPPIDDERLGLVVVHRRYVPYSHAHYAGGLVDGAYALGLFGDAATEVCIRTDGDEGLFASYDDVQFRAPIRAGDVVEVTAAVTWVGSRSRQLMFTASVICRGRPDRSGSAAEVLDPPLLAVTAQGTVVVPPAL